MNIEDIKEERTVIENAVRELLGKFMARTGCNVKEVNLCYVDTTTIGGTRDDVLSEIELILEIPK